MPTSLTKEILDLLGVYSGPWGPSATPAGVIGTNVAGTAGNDDLTYNNLLSGLLVNGGAGNDRIHITGGLTLASTIQGGDGSDQIYGGTGIDIINGGNGNDFIEGGAGIDTLTGGSDIDTLSYEHATVARGITGVTVALNANGGATMAAGGTNAGVDLITDGFENIVGSAFNDTLTGNSAANVLIGLAGNDSLNGGAGNDTIDGGNGNDQLYGGDGDDRIDGGAGNDQLYAGDGKGRLDGGAGDDILYGGSGDNVLYGGDGDDQFYGGDGGNDQHFGENGNDTFYFSHFPDTMDGGTGIDTVDYSGSPGIRGGATVNLKTGFGGDDVEGDRYVSIENVIGTNRNDDIWGNELINTMDGNRGNDRFFYASLSDLGGDRINNWEYSATGGANDKIVLRGLGLHYNNFSSFTDEGVTTFTINNHGFNYKIEIAGAFVPPVAENVFIL